MVVQHNMQAMNASRMLNITTGSQAKSTEKLSSGYRINRAADDAAGLSISEKMRKQIKGLTRASTNAQDGVSAVQTAEGALTEVHSMLQRMNELAVQAANGTNSSTDRQSIQDEINQLVTEIDRVAETTKFNETYLLKGDSNNTSSITLVAHDAGLKGSLSIDKNTGVGTLTLDLPTEATDRDKAETYSVGGKEYTIIASGSGSFDKKLSDLDALIQEELEAANNIGGVTATVSGSGASWTITPGKVDDEVLSFNLHVGADADMTNKIQVNIHKMDANYLGIKNLDVKGAEGDNGIAATYAIDAISDALAKVSEQRSSLGAIQNRLEHTIANVDNVVENSTAAESRIRDTDMANEMVNFSKNNILAQAGQSMLAQANQSNQGVLALLG